MQARFLPTAVGASLVSLTPQYYSALTSVLLNNCAVEMLGRLSIYQITAMWNVHLGDKNALFASEVDGIT